MNNVTVRATVVIFGFPTKSVFDHDKIESEQRNRSKPKKTTQVFVYAWTRCTATGSTKSSKSIAIIKLALTRSLHTV